ncbi:MAG: branched-chain amino acid ABC transporter permease [Deltaproteobacteria bacterium]|nr:branched-chain amino acid ABC transporter permease [Deltaproteobacteria bacterium]
MLKDRHSTEGGRNLTKLAICAGLVIILALLPLFIKSRYMIHIFILTFVYIIATVSLRTITISGQLPLAHAAFMGIGGYVAAVPSKWFGWPPCLTIPMGAFTAMAIGALIGYPFARLRALYYAMVSLFFGIGVLQVFFVLQRWTNAYHGLTGIPGLFQTNAKVPYYYFFLALSVVCLLFLYRFEFCRIGMTLKAIEQSYLVAASVGINEAKYRIIVLAVGCFFAGLAGGTYAHYMRALSYTSFDLLATLWLFMYALIGGIGHFAGPIIGTVLLIIVPELSRGMKGYVPYISAVILLIVVFFMPEGLVGLPKLIRSLTAKGDEKKAEHDAS